MSHRIRRVTLAAALSVASLASLGSTALHEAAHDAEWVASLTSTRIRFEGAPGTVTSVAGGRFAEAIEVLRAPGGDLVVVNDLTMQGYVAGIAEMPTRWPVEALKAQAVAARTYAWFELAQGRWRRFGYDICATTSCQVFKGIDVVANSETGANWQRAVDETDGEVLVHGGRPILARYFSTSGGQTWDNDVVFPSEGAYPYLQGVEDPDDATSPLHRWQVRFTRDQFDELLSRGDTLSRSSPMTAIATVPSPEPGRIAKVVVTGPDGNRVEVSPAAFRTFVSNVAPSLWPDDYPGLRLDGSARLPTTMPSTRFSITHDAESVIIDGRGWGHGVGMGQYGALGKAERGLDHAAILATYYGGLQPTRADDVPSRVRVGLSASRGEVPLYLDGPSRLVVGATVVSEHALGTWVVQDRPDGNVSLRAPKGFGEPLEVAATTTTRELPNEVEVITLRAAVNKPVELRLDVRDEAGALVSSEELGVQEAGSVAVPWSLDDVSRRALTPGTWEVALVGRDETGEERGTAATVTIRPFRSGADGASLPASVWTGAATTSGPLLPDVSQLALAVVLGVIGGRLGVAAFEARHRRRGMRAAAT